PGVPHNVTAARGYRAVRGELSQPRKRAATTRKPVPDLLLINAPRRNAWARGICALSDARVVVAEALQQRLSPRGSSRTRLRSSRSGSTRLPRLLFRGPLA